MPDTRVRKCERDDIPSIVTIEKTSFSDPYPRTFFERLLLWAGGGFLVASGDEEVVGYVVFGTEPAGASHLVSIAVAPEARRSGIGRMLMDAAILRLVEEDVREVVLEVRPSNGGAIAFYREFGFAESGRRPRYYQDGEDAVVMSMRLPEGSALRRGAGSLPPSRKSRGRSP